MQYEDYMKILNNVGYKLKNGIFIDKKKGPKCNNEVFQDLVERQQNNEKLTEKEYNLYGYLMRSLVHIVLNNSKFKYQEQHIKEECELEAYCCLCDQLLSHFDKNRGSSAYSYAFRLSYTAMIHVLEKMNKRKELEEKLIEDYMDSMNYTTGEKVEGSWSDFLTE